MAKYLIINLFEADMENEVEKKEDPGVSPIYFYVFIGVTVLAGLLLVVKTLF
jgi:hypothetical protein